MDADVVAMLPPGRRTHVTPSPDGTLTWVQETDDGHDVAFVLSADGVPRAIALTSGRVLAALQLPSPAAGGSGNVQSLAAGRDGRIWFYFAGGAGRTTIACVGTFDPRDESIRIVLDTRAVEKASGMGPSLVLVRGTILCDAGGALWLWLRHSDGSGLFRIDAKNGAVSRPFEAVKKLDGAPLTLSRPGLAMGRDSDGLLLIDTSSVELWRIDATGRATSVHPLVGLPSVLSAPVADGAGRVFCFAADAPLIPARTDEEASKPVLPVRYPAMLLFENGALRAIGKYALTAPNGFNLDEMRIQQLIVGGEGGVTLRRATPIPRCHGTLTPVRASLTARAVLASACHPEVLRGISE